MPDGLPDDLKIDPKVFVDYYVSHVAHFTPWDFRMKRSDMLRDASSGFSNYGHIVQYGLYSSGIAIEILMGQTSN